LTTDKQSVGTTATPIELNVETDVTITATSVMGFTGDVNLSVAATDSSGTAIPATDWVLTLDSSSVNIATAGGTATAHLAIIGTGTAAALSGNVVVTAMAGGKTTTTTIPVTFMGQFRVDFTDDGQGNCKYVPSHSGTPPTSAYQIKAGYKIAVYNMATTSTLPFIVHSDGKFGMAHQNTGGPGTAVGSAYIQGPLTLAGATATPNQFYCHPGTPTTSFLQPGNSGDYQAFITVQ
jgi:hypothetical protein